MNPPSKVCTGCGESKPETLEFFERRGGADDRLRTKCKHCRNENRRTRDQARIHVVAPEGTLRTCSRCKEDKPASSDHFYSNKSGKYGLREVCKQCNTIVQAERRARPGHTEKRLTGDARRRSNHRHRWGDEMIYEKLVEHQGEQCAICKTTVPGGPGKRFAIDHCHESGVVRGLLCSSHNTALGQFADDEVLLAAAIAYVLNPPCAGLGLAKR